VQSRAVCASVALTRPRAGGLGAAEWVPALRSCPDRRLDGGRRASSGSG